MVNKFHYLKGGSETFYFSLAEILKIAGHEVIFFSMEDEQNVACEQAKYFVSNVNYAEGRKSIAKKVKAVNVFYSFEAKNKIKALIEKENPDIVHLGLVHRHITLSIVDVIKSYGIPIVFSVHDLISVCPCYTMLSPNGVCRECLDNGVMSCVHKKCVKDSMAKSILAVLENLFIKSQKYYDKIDLYLTQCEFYQKILTESNFTNSRIECMTNFLPPSKQFQFNLIFGGYFLYFGRFSREKGILTLLKAYKKADISTPLVLVGGGPDEETVKKFINNNALEDRVSLLGYVYGEKMEELITNSRAVIVPSEWYENCPYTIIESMAKSKIVIASRISGLTELIIDGQTGFLFQPGASDEMRLKIEQVDGMTTEEFAHMSRAIYSYACEKFDHKRYLDKLLALYNSLLSAKDGEKKV